MNGPDGVWFDQIMGRWRWAVQEIESASDLTTDYGIPPFLMHVEGVEDSEEDAWKAYHNIRIRCTIPDTLRRTMDQLYESENP